MAFLRTEAIVIKAVNLREADKIITFFSKDYGKIQGVAKGIRKIKTHYSGKLGLFNRVQVIFFQKAEALQSSGFTDYHPLLRITQVDVVEVFPQLQSDFNKIIGASYIAEFLNKLFEEYDDTHKAVYNLVCETLRTLSGSDTLRNIISAFEIKLLAHLGYTPILDHCTVCGKTRCGVRGQRSEEQGTGNEYKNFATRNSQLATYLGFSSSTGGILCQRCKPLKKDSLDVTPQSIEILHQFLNTEMTQIPTISLPKGAYREIKALLMHHYQYHTGVSLKTEKFVQKLRSANIGS
jgi:DNA repair protein RecO (recombination protein O)